jgi:hypothetical protein
MRETRKLVTKMPVTKMQSMLRLTPPCRRRILPSTLEVKESPDPGVHPAPATDRELTFPVPPPSSALHMKSPLTPASRPTPTPFRTTQTPRKEATTPSLTRITRIRTTRGHGRRTSSTTRPSSRISRAARTRNRMSGCPSSCSIRTRTCHALRAG